MKRWKKTRFEAQRAKPRTPTPAIDALIGDEEQTEKEEITGSGSLTQLSWTLQSPSTTRRDHTVSLFLKSSPPPSPAHLLLILLIVLLIFTSYVSYLSKMGYRKFVELESLDSKNSFK